MLDLHGPYEWREALLASAEDYPEGGDELAALAREVWAIWHQGKDESIPAELLARVEKALGRYPPDPQLIAFFARNRAAKQRKNDG